MQILVENFVYKKVRNILDELGLYEYKEIKGGLGFRRLHNFNLALLGKQGWRLITNPECLLSKIYEGRYYPWGNFLNANLGCNPSFVWQSILESQTMLKSGTGCRLGSGTTVDIKNDPWFPCAVDPYIHTNNGAING